FLNVDREEVIGQPLIQLLKMEPNYSLRNLLVTPNELILEWLQQDGQPLIVKAKFSMIKKESGFITGLVCVLHVVTEQEKNELERREFVSNVSHELRTPLTSMRSYVDALIDGSWQNPEIAPQFLGVIQEETERMIRMINDLLHLSRLDAEKEN